MSSPSRRRVYLHIGLPKTGTTYLQRALWSSRDQLAALDVLIPGKGPASHLLAARDLLGRRAPGVRQANLVGSWQRLADEVRQAGSPSTVVSEEFLVYARPRHVKAVQRAFEPAELHVVVTVRDLGRLLGSAWQHELTKGQTATWAEFVAAVRAADSDATSIRVGFWMRHDIPRILSAWESVVPQERIHVVVVPGSGAAPTALLDRFAEAVGLEPDTLTAPEREANVSLGAVEAESLRRLNVSLGGGLNEAQYVRVVKGAVLPALARRSSDSRRVELSEDDRGWAREVSAPWVDLLRQGSYHVVGDVAELMPPAAAASPGTPGAIDQAALAAANAAALESVVEAYSTFWWRARRRPPEVEVGARARIASAARSWSFKTRVHALALADRNRFFARAASGYLRRTSAPD